MEILESSVSCIEGHTPIKDDIKELKYYLLPWITIDDDKEFRMFVCNNRITAISQQHIYKVNKLLKKLSEEEMKSIIDNWIVTINDYFNEIIKQKITHVDNYVIDLAILENNEVYFIEINSFGKEYASGSALFHWILDEDKLYESESESCIYFRYVSD